MPDTYKTFLSPGSCQLEVTDLVASANDDKGVDLYGVAWEIEQVLIAGEGFAASPTDVWVNERGILNVGKSLFDKINRTAEDNDNIPGQCTVVVKATSLVDSSKVARLKVLVGYPGEGGGGGGGSIKFVPVPYYTDTEPVVGGYATESVLYPGCNATSMIVDGLEILNDSNSSSFLYFIAGSTVTQYATSDTFVGIYTVTIGEDDLHGDPVFKTVTAWSSDDYTIDDENEGVTYTYPDLAENEYVVLYVSSIGR